MKKLLLIPFILIFSIVSIFAQQLDLSNIEIEPYDPEEFPPELRELRRSEIITFGSYPFATMFVGAGYSFYKYFANGMDPKYAVNPLRKASSANLSDMETKGIILGAAGLSLGIGIVDFFLNRIMLAKEEQARNENLGTDGLDEDIKIIPVYKNKAENSSLTGLEN